MQFDQTAKKHQQYTVLFHVGFLKDLFTTLPNVPHVHYMTLCDTPVIHVF